MAAVAADPVVVQEYREIISKFHWLLYHAMNRLDINDGKRIGKQIVEMFNNTEFDERSRIYFGVPQNNQ
uniref:Uncharacterized protein n=1 Tax=Panagrolaimus sp. ES5 TaxID=591445 RepID=A0AC34FH29_9BILA